MGLMVAFYRRKQNGITEETENVNDVRTRIYNDIFLHKTDRKKGIADETEVCRLENIAVLERCSTLLDAFRYADKAYSCGVYGENSAYVEVEKWEVEDFIRKAKATLEEKDRISEDHIYLKPKKGLFFGNEEINEDYFKEIETCLAEFEKMLADTDFSEYQVLMFATW